MDDHSRQEIIIIKRGGEEEDGHHGGAWKIAFADFMTAMMALFLVLWLINAANEETKRAVASYFNPIKLVDRNRSSKGIEETNSGPTYDDQVGKPADPVETKSVENPQSGPQVQDHRSGQSAEGIPTEEAFFADPMAALEKIEASVLEKSGISNKLETEGEDGKPGKFTDPFNSEFWEEKSESKTGVSKDAQAPTNENEFVETETGLAAETAPGQSATEAKRSEAAEFEKQVRQDIADKLGEGASAETAIKVSQTDNGILIQITDTPSLPMFGVGSAVPNGETIVAINAIAGVLGKKPGQIHIHGHTDARKFDADGNGNWRLSVNRAQSIYLMLLRAGLPDSRVSEIAGFADRKPVVEKDPLADQNRRIEIFLENP